VNLGISVLDDRLLLVSHQGHDKSPEFEKYDFKQKRDSRSSLGLIWDLVDISAGDAYLTADRLVLSIPASICYLKRLEIDSDLIENYPDYLEWLACTLLPGKVAQYKYEFISAGRSYDETRLEMIFTAVPIGPLNELFQSLKINDDAREIIAIPEQLGLIKALEKSFSNDDIPQAGIVNCNSLGAAIVLLKNSRFYHSRFFPIHQDHADELAVDIETYLLSQIDSSDPMPLLVTGLPELFKTSWTPLHPSYLPVHNLEFTAAWGALEYDFSSGAK
jgi:hypothetical protein